MECGLGIVYHSATSRQGFIHKVEGRSVGENCSGALTRGQVWKTQELRLIERAVAERWKCISTGKSDLE